MEEEGRTGCQATHFTQTHTHTYIVQSIFVLDSYPVEKFVLKGQHNSALTFIHAACLEERVFLHLAQNKLHKSKAFLTKKKNKTNRHILEVSTVFIMPFCYTCPCLPQLCQHRGFYLRSPQDQPEDLIP